MTTRKDKFAKEKIRDLERQAMIANMYDRLICCDNCHTWQHPKGKKGSFICPKCGSDMHEN